MCDQACDDLAIGRSRFGAYFTGNQFVVDDVVNDAPVVVDFVVHQDAMVWPMVPAGVSNDEILAARGQRPDFGDSED